MRSVSRYLLVVLLLSASHRVTGAERERVALPEQLQAGRLLYQASLADPESVRGWRMEGPGEVTFQDGWMHMQSPGEAMHHVFWCPERFPGSFIAQWEAQNLETDAGLCIVFFAAAGQAGQSVLADDLPPRDGTFTHYTQGAIRCYHISYYANTPDTPDRGHANLRKNPGFHLVQEGQDGIPAKSQSIHTITLAKLGSQIRLCVDDRRVIDWTDTGEVGGAPHTDGYLGFRQMQWTHFRYRNLRVWEVEESAIPWKAGVASVVITPEEPMWMAGYASRTKPAEGKVHDLNAKALALEDARGTRLAIVTLDLISIPRDVRHWLEKQAAERYQLPPKALLINASHTHCGPELRADKVYLPEGRGEQSEQYVEGLQSKLADLIGLALANLEPVSLSYAHARAGFAMNRRTPTENGFQNHPYPDGPVDHQVPVLQVSTADKRLKAILFGYACHSTTLSFYQFCGDYSGFAQRYLEEKHPGATALFLAGCGGDQNPYPRGELELCEQHGRALANGVEAALQTRARPVRGPLRSALGEVTLEFATPPGREELVKRLESKNQWERRHAERLLKELQEAGQLRTTYPTLVQVVRFGNDLTLVALPGETVVDYSLRLKNELPGPAVWVAGYSNDVFGYLPSLRVLDEGGYEGGGAMLYTSLPGPFAPSVEQLVVDKVHALLHDIDSRSANQSSRP